MEALEEIAEKKDGRASVAMKAEATKLLMEDGKVVGVEYVQGDTAIRHAGGAFTFHGRSDEVRAGCHRAQLIYMRAHALSHPPCCPPDAQSAGDQRGRQPHRHRGDRERAAQSTADSTCQPCPLSL